MRRMLHNSVVMLLALTLVTGIVYPLASTIALQAIVPGKASGSVLKKDDHVLGSTLLGQEFSQLKYFWGRPSTIGYNAAKSDGSGYGVTHPQLFAIVQTRIDQLKKAGHQPKDTPIPVDLVTPSGSGLDPHISKAAAQYQIARVAHARKLSEEKVKALVKEHTQPRQWGILGEPRVHVLSLNLALDSYHE